jgi:hypothetical protein
MRRIIREEKRIAIGGKINKVIRQEGDQERSDWRMETRE